MAERERRSERKLVTFEVETKNVYMVVYEAVWINKRVEGFYTQAGFPISRKNQRHLLLFEENLHSQTLPFKLRFLVKCTKHVY